MTRTEPAVLERDRIDRMRAEVMGAVEQDRRRRRRRGQVVLGGVAAAAVVVVGGLVGLGLTGTEQQADISAGSADVGVSGDARSAVEDAAPDDAAPVEPVVTTGSISTEVEDVGAAVRRIRSSATGWGGRIDAESTDGGRAPWADLTVRIPPARLTDLREALDELGTVRSSTVERENVAARVADVESRIASLESSIRRLRQLIERSETTADLLQAESQLTQRQGDLESLQAQQRVLADQTSLATVQVSLYVKTGQDPQDHGGFLGGLEDGWEALVSTSRAVVTAVGFVLPWLLPLGALAGLAWAVRRRRAVR